MKNKKEKCVEHILVKLENINETEENLQSTIKKQYPNKTVFLRREIANNEPNGVFLLKAFIL